MTSRLCPLSGLALALVALALACGEAEAPVPPPSSLSATAGDSVVRLTWTHAGDPPAAVVIRRGVSAPPADPASGEAVYSGAATSHVDPCPKNGATYHYAAFARDAAGAHSSAVTATARCVLLPFTLIVVPDTQYYSEPMYRVAIKWVLDQRQQLNAACLLHEGDMTHNDSHKEWKVVAAALGRLDNVLPYALAVGNHDMSPNTGGDTSKFNSYFPLARVSKLPGFGGSFPAGKLDNSYHVFRAGGTNWLVLSLIYDPKPAALKWANGVVAQHPGRRVIVLTHAYLTPSATLGAPGKAIWQGLVRQHRGMTFVFNGHYINGQGARLVSTGDQGNKVYQMFANYQDTSLSGSAALRLVRVDPVGRSVKVKTYSTLSGKYVTIDAHQFSYTNVELGPLSK